MPCLDAVLKICRRGADKQSRVAALLKQSQQTLSTSTYKAPVLASTRNWVVCSSSGFKSCGLSTTRGLFVHAAEQRQDRKQVVAMSEVEKAKSAAASG